jgi:sugar O-acyltransferase (sialic acid O-acetyltransferase NeuD family)
MVGWILSDNGQVGETVLGFPVLGTDADLVDLLADDVIDSFVVGLGMVEGGGKLRPSLYDAGIRAGLSAITIVHPSAVIAQSARIGAGSVVMAGAIINPGAVVGGNVIINSGAVIEHDCKISDHVHIGPRAVLSGHVSVGENTIVGVGTTCLQGLSIGAGVTIGAGSVVIRNVDDDQRVAGNPARPLNRKITT